MNREQTEGKHSKAFRTSTHARTRVAPSPLLRSQSIRAAAHGLRRSREEKVHQVERWVGVDGKTRVVWTVKTLFAPALIVVSLIWFGVSLWTWWRDGNDYVSAQV